jgi:hypothetical protein
MRIKATLRVPRVDFAKYRRALQEVLGDAIAQAAFEWLGATTAVIPVWSGASLSTFQPLASAVGFSLSVHPVSFQDRVGLGLSNATGEIVADSNTGQFTFTYTTTLAHLIYNEFNNANISPDPTLFSRLLSPGPYRFQEKGLAAFKKVAEDVRLPDPTFSITTFRVQ